MKKTIYTLLSLLCLFSCGKKDKFECGVQNEMAPADDSAYIFIPTAYSPNGDGLNDVFLPWCLNVKSIDFSIYDNDNKLQFHTTELNHGWGDILDIESGIRLFHYKFTAITNQDNTILQCGDFYAYKCLPKGFDGSTLIFGDQFNPNEPHGYLKGSSNEIFRQCE